MCNPKMINIELRASFGIKILKPFNAAIETAIIGPIIQAKGIASQSNRMPPIAPIPRLMMINSNQCAKGLGDSPVEKNFTEGFCGAAGAFKA